MKNIGNKIIELKDSQETDRKTICEQTGVHPNTIKKIEETSDGVLSKILTIFKAFGYNKAKLVIWKEKNGKKSNVTEMKL